jgi:hypothetical protein
MAQIYISLCRLPKLNENEYTPVSVKKNLTQARQEYVQNVPFNRTSPPENRLRANFPFSIAGAFQKLPVFFLTTGKR